ncbi:MAG TPA: BON domain-containing protein [Aliidongia sp.]|uniref:BON domain-containing protein n=1 Tax=Aliidongia sp. TaxID=1914230 RepID=UPI002DDD5D74|nr:BON domain-containing protein [Aliidongia sp.]HEV2673700.1 BON domain-containing protein [Aliidongia sp.]
MTLSHQRVLSLALSLTALASATLPLGGCFIAAVGAAAGAGGYTMGNERGIGGTASDTGIKTEINAIWAKDNGQIPSYVDLNIFEGRVLLTGGVPDPKIRDQAVAGAWKASGVKEVINEIQVAQGASFSTAASDNWILARLNSDMVFDGAVRTPNYSLQCVDGTVYILGIARTQNELDHVLNYARNIPNVRQVKNYIRIRSGIGEDGGTQLGTSGGNTQPSALSAPDAGQPGVSQRATGGGIGSGDSRDPALNSPPRSGPIQVTPLQ